MKEYVAFTTTIDCSKIEFGANKMSHKTWLTFLMLMVCTCTFSQDIRGLSWRDGREAIISVEGAPDSEAAGTSGWDNGLTRLVYMQKWLLQYSCQLMFYLDENGLVLLRYFFIEGNDYTKSKLDEIFRTLQNALTDKYGQPIAKGESGSGWTTERTGIELSKLTDPNGQVLVLDYTDLSFLNDPSKKARDDI